MFNFFKKKESDIIEIVKLLGKNKIKVPNPKYTKTKISREDFYKLSDRSHENFKATELLKDKGCKPLIGVIVGYHPAPKDIYTAMTAVVEWPVYKKSEKTFVVDCSSLGKISGVYDLAYPREGTWIWFVETVKAKDTDKKTRTYGIAEIVFEPKVLQSALKAQIEK